ncbi:hypothetical protein O3Q52_50235 [Streptomyces sp. ActVer]|nr:hypothetical protein [Streptomyces sp. ActVer]MCZ4516152.1 hypothetical protein [Streptomyces sp. ActVer]
MCTTHSWSFTSSVCRLGSSCSYAARGTLAVLLPAMPPMGTR